MNDSSAQTDLIASTERETQCFLEILSQIERLHRLVLDALKDELYRNGIREINAVQAM